MKIPRLTFLLCCIPALLAEPAISAPAATELKSAVNWSDFLARHDLVWDSAPAKWDEGAFIGNGLLGAMIYADGTNPLQWDIGRSDVADRGDRIGIGNFALKLPRPVVKSSLRLDLWNAEARGTLTTEQGQVNWRSFTHASDLVNIIELTAPAGAPLPLIVFNHAPAVPARLTYQKAAIPANELNPDATLGATNGVNWCLQSFKAGGGYVVAWTERADAPGRRLFYFTVDYTAKDTPNPAKAVADVLASADAKLNDLVESHRAWWHTYYPQSFLSIPDTRMESFYWIQMYKLAAATRADRPAIDLMGPWFRSTPWPRIWWNLNIQLTYWPVYAANRLALGESLTRMIDADRENLINNVPSAWRIDAAAIGRSSPYNGVRPVGDGTTVGERGNLTWTLHNYWLQYRYSGDEIMLKDRLYPILKRAIGYYLHLLAPGPDGKLHLPVSISPEYPKNAPDTNYDLSLLTWGLQTLLATDARFDLHDPLAETWRTTLANLTPFSVDDHGFMVGKGVPFDQSHRHFSHLFMVYPLHLIDPQSATARPLIEKSVDHWLSMKTALRGYSFTGASAMSAWLGRKTDVVPYLDQFLEFREGKTTTRFPVRANTMYTEAGPVIETPLSGAATIHEIVLQSWSMQTFGTHIRVFPAVPDNWKDVSFDKLLAEGAFEVSAVRRDGKTRCVQITSLAGAPCRVSTSLEGKIVASGIREFKITTDTENNQPVTVID